MHCGQFRSSFREIYYSGAAQMVVLPLASQQLRI
jgi:hypothetical protein